MNFVKEWIFGTYITLIVCVVISLLLPSGVIGKYGRVILSLFIFVSFLIPFTDGDISFAFPDMQISDVEEQEEDTYSSLISAKVKSSLENAGYDGVNVDCSVTLVDEEITINSLTVSIPDEYSKDEVKSLIYDSLGLAAEVYYIGE
ncbi:MAG: stage III sporulation protein AF [Clostridiales bacterium]|nr:stage III sporulation protein AF [Clostridiales bacterium]